MKEEKIFTVEEIESANSVENIVAESGGKGFSYYTSYDTAKKILGNGCIHVSNAYSLNDLEEGAALSESERCKTFILCFCASNIEQIPMWYLYSGITGEGIRLRFSAQGIKRLITEEYGIRLLDSHNKEIAKLSSRDFDIHSGWVIYNSDDRYSIFKGKKGLIEKEIIDQYAEKCMVKDYPWNYEKEYRIVYSYKLEKGDVSFSEDNKISIDIPDKVFSTVQVMTGPEFLDETIEEFENCDEIKIFREKADKRHQEIKKSELKIKMNLINRNKQSIVECFSRLDWNSEELKELYKQIRALRKRI